MSPPPSPLCFPNFGCAGLPDATVIDHFDIVIWYSDYSFGALGHGGNWGIRVRWHEFNREQSAQSFRTTYVHRHRPGLIGAVASSAWSARVRVGRLGVPHRSGLFFFDFWG